VPISRQNSSFLSRATFALAYRLSCS